MKPTKRRNSSTGSSTRSKIDNSNSIKVVCRFRPPKTETEMSKAFEFDPESNSVTFTGDFVEKKSFSFDRVFFY
jgi:hypothetical protein